MPVKPLSPKQVQEAQQAIIPDAVITAVNEILTREGASERITFTQDTLIARVLELDPSLTRQQLFAGHMLDFEPLFRKAGWKVTYDKPGYCESYDAYFEFSR